jgi:N-acetyl-anhydromuramyl-L-alanine amidase AmpD
LKPYLEAMMVTMIENKIDYLLEGVHFKPQMIREILDRYPGKIKSVFLGYRDIETSVKIQELSIFGKDTENHWYKRMNESELKNLVNYLKNESELLYIECQKYGFDYVEINNINDQSENIIHRLFNNE